MDIIEIIEQYGLLNLLIGLLSVIICGILKIPIVEALEAKNYDAKTLSDKTRFYCSIIVFCVSAGATAVIAAIRHSFVVDIFIQDTLLAYTCAKMLYAVYEGYYKNGEGVISLKNWVNKLYDWIVSKLKGTVTDKTEKVLTAIQNAFTEVVKLPLTDEQLASIKEKIKTDVK